MPEGDLNPHETSLTFAVDADFKPIFEPRAR